MLSNAFTGFSIPLCLRRNNNNVLGKLGSLTRSIDLYYARNVVFLAGARDLENVA